MNTDRLYDKYYLEKWSDILKKWDMDTEFGYGSLSRDAELNIKDFIYSLEWAEVDLDALQDYRMVLSNNLERCKTEIRRANVSNKIKEDYLLMNIKIKVIDSIKHWRHILYTDILREVLEESNTFVSNIIKSVQDRLDLIL